MTSALTRRHLLGAAGGITIGAMAGPVFAQTAGGTLARLQAAKKVRVGIANQPPYSALNPDGTVTGAAPEITKVIMGRLGITEIEGLIGTYGELIPGMQAGRWDFVSASLTITPVRCGQVLFADPIVVDGTAIIYLKGAGDLKPTSLAELAKAKVTVALQQGGALFRAAVGAGIDVGNLRQFTDDPAIVDAITSKRAQFGVMSYSPMRNLIKQRNLDLAVGYPVTDNPPNGSSVAFRQADTDLHAAYQKELRAMKASGEFTSIVSRFGFDMPPDMLKITAEQACKG